VTSAETRSALDEALRHHRSGRPDLAEPVYRRVTEAEPDCAEAWHLLGIVALQRGEGATAQRLIARAVELAPGDAKFRTNLANSVVVQGNLAAAEPILRAAISADAGYADAHYALGHVLRDSGRLKEAEASLRRAIELEPGHAKALNDLGAMLKNQSRLDEAVALLERARDAAPDDWGVLWNLSSALELANRLDEATAVVERLMALRADDAVTLLMASRLARRRGDNEMAADRAATARTLADDGGVRLNACFELGIAFEKSGRADEAFKAFAEGNRLQAATGVARRIDRAAYPGHIAACREWFDDERLGRPPPGRPDGTPPPVFFVGFPRSGTTLFEQVLAAHPGIVTTDEISPLGRLRASLDAEFGGTGVAYPGYLERIESADWAKGRAVFWRSAREIVGNTLDGRRLVDKLPLNIVELGLVDLFFPDATVIVAIRDPRDVCLSCFMQQFRLNSAMIHFTGLESTAALYVRVMDLWRHYRAHMSPAWIEYRYEDLIRDVEGTTRRILDFVGLPWHDAIRGYRERAAGRAISTPSYRDVANPLTDRAVARWRAYESHLAPVSAALRPFVDEFGYGDS
jgi:Flp pilus assembly protein TadD